LGSVRVTLSEEHGNYLLDGFNGTGQRSG
jgi:hypothetical protein